MSASEDVTNSAGRKMYYLAALVLLGLLWLFFDQLMARLENPNRHVVAGEGAELMLKRNRWGHYVAPGTINGHKVIFMLDTGATRVSVPAHLGSGLQLKPGGSSEVATANGTVKVRNTQIDELVLGPFTLRNIPAHLNPGMRDDEVLLGMNVLRHLDFSQQGETLILRKRQQP